MKKMLWLTYLLWMVGMVSGIAAVLILFYPQEEISADTMIAPASIGKKTVDPWVRHQGAFDAYEKVFSRRDVFETSTRFLGMLGEDGAKMDEGLKPFVDLAEKYQVVGIMVDQHPQAALQDKETQETVFLSIGDQLDGAVIDHITAGKVVLRFNGQAVELKP